MRNPEFGINHLINDLQGSCKSIPDALPEGMYEEDLTDNELGILDGSIFCCETCGWWCDVSEMADGSHDWPECENCHCADDE